MIFFPNYVDTYLSCSAIPGFDFENHDDIPGFRLLAIRAKETLESICARKEELPQRYIFFFYTSLEDWKKKDIGKLNERLKKAASIITKELTKINK